jgi:hypothetical protein
MKRFAIVTVALWSLAACGGSEKNTETAPLPPEPAPAAEVPAEPAEPTPAPEAPAEAAAYQPTPEDQTKLEELTGAIVAIGDAAESNQPDCGAVGNSIVQITQDNQHAFEWAETVEADPAKARWLDAEVNGNDAVVGAVTKIQTAAQSCMNDPAFQQAMEQLSSM